MTATVAMVLTSHAELGASGRPTGFWLEEVAAPYEAFRNAGFDVVLASPRGGAVPADPASLTDDAVTDAVRRFRADVAAMARLDDTVRIDTLAATSFDAVFLVGGHGAMWDFAGLPELTALLDRAYHAGGVVASVCHGAAGLLGDHDLPWLHDRALTGFSQREEEIVGATGVVPFSLEQRLVTAGARFNAGAPFGVHVVRDGQLVTGQNPASSTACAAGVVAAVQERRAAAV